MNGDELSERKKLILKAIIDSHIENGEPVGSKYLMQSRNISYSSATIRNEMAELEAMGYLEQPHTSAGRIPSETGYRFYVDALVERYNFTNREIGELKMALRAKQAELDSILEAGIKLASAMTNYTALALRPTGCELTVSRYEIMKLDFHSLLLVMVMNDGEVKTKHIRSEYEISDSAALRLKTVLNASLVNIAAASINMLLLMEMERFMGDESYLITPIVKAVCEAITPSMAGEISVEGLNKLLSYPEYSDTDRLKRIIELFERKRDLVEVMNGAGVIPSSADDDKVHIYIGSENIVKIMNNSTFIVKPVISPRGTMGAIGVIGPTRMDYSKVITLLDQLSSGISDIISEDVDGGG